VEGGGTDITGEEEEGEEEEKNDDQREHSDVTPCLLL
jgi:hypothetical protein